jgi:DNA-binding PadR family transcriptional regulator
MNKGEHRKALPLSPKVLHILMALAAEPMNGYQLGLRVEGSSEGMIRMSPGTLYENLHRLASRGLIEEVEDGAGREANGRGQRFYGLTRLGMEVLEAEVGRLTEDVALARSILASST